MKIGKKVAEVVSPERVVRKWNVPAPSIKFPQEPEAIPVENWPKPVKKEEKVEA